MTSQQLQQALFMGGVIGIALGVVMIGIAIFIFFRYDIRGIHDDLTGKKRAEDIAKKQTEQARGKQSGRKSRAKQSQEQLAAGVHTDNLAQVSTGTGSSGTESAEVRTASSANVDKAATKAKKNNKNRSASKPIPQGSSDEENTTVIGLDREATTVLSDKPDDQTTTLIGSEEADDDKQATTPEVSLVDIQVEEHAADEVVSDDEALSTENHGQRNETPDYFQIVEKIVLTDSAGYARTR